MAISDRLNNAQKVTLSELESGSAIKDFPTKSNGDIAALQQKVNDLVDLVNKQNQVIKELEARYISALNTYRSEVVDKLDQFYVKKTQN